MRKNIYFLSLMFICVLVIVVSCKKHKKESEPDPATTYTITFNSNGGSAINPQTVESGGKAKKPTDPDRTGFTFTGWYGEATAFDFDAAVTANVELTAMWEPVKNQTDFDVFLKTARFMPNDPRAMTADDKSWFSQNGSFDFTFVFKPQGFTITPEQENQLKVYFEGAMKTFNYMVYTKPAALATKAMFADRGFFYDKTNDKTNLGPDPLPSAVGTLLALRGLNTNVIRNKVFTVNLQKRDGSYLGSVLPIPLNPDRDKYTAEELAAGKRTDFRLPADGTPEAYLSIPLGDDLNTLRNYEDYWMYDKATLDALDKTDPKHPFARGFNYDLIIHEMLHALLHWNHAGGGQNTDLVYSYAGMLGLLMNQRGEEREILTVSKILPSGNNSAKNSEDYIKEFGGHMPMASYRSVAFHYGFWQGTYNLYSMYMQSQLNVPVYIQPLPVGTLFYSNTKGPNPGDEKAVPPNPYDGISWKFKYNGIIQ